MVLGIRLAQLPLDLKMGAPHVVDQITGNAKLPMEVGGLMLPEIKIKTFFHVSSGFGWIKGHTDMVTDLIR